MKGYASTKRCFYISAIPGYFSLEDIADHFKVSVRTVKRDIQFLREYGVDVQFDDSERVYVIGDRR